MIKAGRRSVLIQLRGPRGQGDSAAQGRDSGQQDGDIRLHVRVHCAPIQVWGPQAEALFPPPPIPAVWGVHWSWQAKISQALCIEHQLIDSRTFTLFIDVIVKSRHAVVTATHTTITIRCRRHVIPYHVDPVAILKKCCWKLLSFTSFFHTDYFPCKAA